MTIDRLSDDEFLAAFQACRLQAADFDHRAHVRMAWLLLERQPLEEASGSICAGIQRFALHLGATTKFHRTISEALTRLIASKAAAGGPRTWPGFAHAHPELMTNVRELLAQYYSPELLSSEAARQRFVAPDRAPLPPCPPRKHDH
jgi:hypothetical protein